MTQPGSLTATLIRAPTVLVSGRKVELEADLFNASQDLLELTVYLVGELLEGGVGGPVVGGSWGWRALTGTPSFIMPAGAKQVVTGFVEARRSTEGPSAPMLARGRYGLRARLSIHIDRPGSYGSLEVMTNAVTVDVVTRIPDS